MNLVANRSKHSALGAYKNSFNSIVTVKAAGVLDPRPLN
jgi:hypothetical protein